MGNPTPPAEGMGFLKGELKKIWTRLNELERPSGTSLNSLVEQVQQALANIKSTVTAAIESLSYTREQTDSRIASPGPITPTTVTATGEVAAPTGRFNGGLYSTDARNFVVTSNYAASWIDVNGHFGISPSTIRFKKDVESWTPEDAERVLAIEAKSYRLSIPQRVILRLGPDGAWVLDDNGYPIVDQVIPAYEDPPDAPLRHGFIAEELVDAGLGFLIVFDDDGLPVSINYAEFTIAQQTALRWLNAQRALQEERLRTIEQHLGIA